MLYPIVRRVVTAFCRLWNRAELIGDGLPAEDGYIIAPIHRSYLDSPVVASIIPRNIRFMGKHTFFPPWFWPMAVAMGAFPVNRDGADRDALRRAVDLLKSGMPVVIFPEGTRLRGREIGPLFEGVAFVAARAGVPIYPVGIAGVEEAYPRGARWIKPHKVTVVVGEPVLVEGPGRRSVREASARLSVNLQDAVNRAYAALESRR